MEYKTIVNTSGTVTISEMEYRQLVTAKAYLDVVLEAQKDEKSYVVDNMLAVVSRCANTVITAEEQISYPDGGVTDA